MCMKYNPNIHRRQSERLRTKNYSTGSYFITICAVNREWLFGEIRKDEMLINKLGAIVKQCWEEIPMHFLTASLDTFVIMPNHIHGILSLRMAEEYSGDLQQPRRGLACQAPTDTASQISSISAARPYRPKFGKPIPGSLPTVIGAFKSSSTRLINKLRNSPATSVWQRNYYEHAIRNNDELQKIRMYIGENPKHWFTDEEYSPEMRE